MPVSNRRYTLPRSDLESGDAATSGYLNAQFRDLADGVNEALAPTTEAEATSRIFSPWVDLRKSLTQYQVDPALPGTIRTYGVASDGATLWVYASTGTFYGLKAFDISEQSPETGKDITTTTSVIPTPDSDNEGGACYADGVIYVLGSNKVVAFNAGSKARDTGKDISTTDLAAAGLTAGDMQGLAVSENYVWVANGNGEVRAWNLGGGRAGAKDISRTTLVENFTALATANLDLKGLCTDGTYLWVSLRPSGYGNLWGNNSGRSVSFLAFKISDMKREPSRDILDVALPFMASHTSVTTGMDATSDGIYVIAGDLDSTSSHIFFISFYRGVIV